MAKAHSFIITLSNNQTESEGLDFVLGLSPELFLPDSIGRKKLLEILGLEKRFLRAFDLVMVSGAKRGCERLEVQDPKSITLIELKTTKKLLSHNPYGFFFGATENEFDLARRLGEQFKFAFVCLHPKKRSTVFLTLEQLQQLIQKKRTQFQINLMHKR
jgi:hypothetical protein